MNARSNLCVHVTIISFTCLSIDFCRTSSDKVSDDDGGISDASGGHDDAE